METIYKYPFPLTASPEIEMPADSWVLTVQVQNGQPCIWAKVNTERPMVTRRFALVGTGHEIPGVVGRYVGSFQQDGVYPGQFVFHLFEEAAA